MLKFVQAGFVAAAVILYNHQPVMAQNLTGYCLDNGSKGCQDRYIPFSRNAIDFCEESCEFTNPVAVRGMEATLYDYKCRSDHAGTTSSRALIVIQSGGDNETRTSMVTRDGTRPIVRCK